MKQTLACLFIMLFFSLNLNANEKIDASFITKYEYGAMLYKNPRGIGCHKCHGQNGQGILIASYKHKDAKTNKLLIKSIQAPAINKLTLEQFRKVIMKKNNRSLVMPTYFLTEDELSSIHYYITNLKK